jgi:hypothetical protein
MTTVSLRLAFVLAPAFLLAACAGLEEFNAGFSRGVDNQQRWSGTPAQKEAYRVADLPRKPADVPAVPGEAYYRCVGEKYTVDYKIVGREWYVKPWRNSMWSPMGCNAGEMNAGMGTTKATCGMNNGIYFATSTNVSQWGMTMVAYYLDPGDDTLRSTTWLNSKEIKTTSQCKYSK